jgi:hypothetical protein
MGFSGCKGRRMIATPMPDRNRERTRARGRRWAIAGLPATIGAALCVLAWAPVGAASPEDPCTPGFTCVTTCVEWEVCRLVPFPIDERCTSSTVGGERSRGRGGSPTRS